ncbi:RNA polymerase sigma factor [Archangium lipolyticum]|uniref:RNA polymerase sigma factor n=1 Tax=Archangium lipolyticum TaxID=2970465 RepID=UPI00214A686B|nr:hypothetical protein [Archangium lipolyticum]
MLRRAPAVLCMVRHMDAEAQPLPGAVKRSPRFATTRWSLILAARLGGTPEAREALTALCELYWYPLYAFVRRRGHAADEAFDLTQGFFARLLEKNDLAVVDRQRGRFRSWLRTALEHYLANEWDRARAGKRGGGQSPVSIDSEEAEGLYGRELSHGLTPEKLFERRWALALLERVVVLLRAEWEQGGKGKLFEKLKGCLTGDKGDTSYQHIASEVGMSEGAVKVAVHRLRRRFRELLESEIAQTVERHQDIEEELRHLFAALS